jgi:hypothetical protein
MLGKESLLDCYYRVVNTPASNGPVYHQIFNRFLPDYSSDIILQVKCHGLA